VAVVASIGSGNWLTAGTWGLVDAASYSNSEASGAVPPTASGTTSRSAAFTPAAGTIDAFGIKFRNRTGTTGTMTVAIILSSDNSVQKTVTVNMTDLPEATTAGLDGGWIIFKPATGLVVDGITAYKIDVTTSSANQATVYSASGNNWSRLLITDTNQAPTTGDDVIVAGSWNSAASANAYVVTMDETAATDYGSDTTSTVTPALAICQNGTLTFKDTSAANPLLRLSGHAIVYSGGTLNIGTTGTPIPRDSVAVLEFDSTVDGGHGLIGRNGSTTNIQGLSRTSGNNTVSCKLNTDEAIDSTSLGVDTDTGWLDDDQIAVASTTKTVLQSELGALNGNAGASSLTVDGFAGAGGGLAFAHSGTAPTQAEVINITRNVKIRSVSSTLMAYANFNATSIVDIDWAEFYYLGQNSTNQRGVEVNTTTGSCSIQFSSIHDTEDGAFTVVGSVTDNITFANNVMWWVSNASIIRGVTVAVTTGTNIVIDNNIIIGRSGFEFSDVGITVNNNTAVSCARGFEFQQGATLGPNSGNVAHSNSNEGFLFEISGINGTVTNLTAWRNNLQGIVIENRAYPLIFDSPVLFGNGGNIRILSPIGGIVYLINPVLNGDTSFPVSNGIACDGSPGIFILDIVNGDLSTVSGIKTAHTTDIVLGTGTQLRMTNTKLGAATQLSGVEGLISEAFVTSQRHNGVAGDHRTYVGQGATTGALRTDSVISHTASPSQRCTPTSASVKLESALKHRGILAPVADTETITISVWVRKSIAGDAGGVLYAGSQPRLILKSNPALGVNDDVVLDTMTVADDSGDWEQLTGTTGAATDDGAFEFVVDCDGTSGAWINVDDWELA